MACEGLPSVRHNNNYIPYTPNCKILEVTFDNNLTFNKYINNKIPLARMAFNNIHRFQHFHPKTRLHLFFFFFFYFEGSGLTIQQPTIFLTVFFKFFSVVGSYVNLKLQSFNFHSAVNSVVISKMQTIH